MKVSVAVPAYKFGPYIRECLDSILSQKTNFNFEIVIRDDYSNDGTDEILLEYSKIHDNIKVLESNENIGFHSNIKLILDNCSGDYICYLDGDDYWINPDKLQIQSDFLDLNPEYSMVFGGYFIQQSEDKSTLTDYYFGIPPEVKGDLGPENFVWGNAVNSLTKMFRNYKDIFKEYFYNFSVIDWPLNLEISKKGKIKFMDVPMGVYRKHDSSLSNIKDNIEVYEKNRNIILENLGPRLTVIIVNLNNLEFTKNCLEDLVIQDTIFNLVIVDQNSTEPGTKEFFDNFFSRHIDGNFYGTLNRLEIINTGYNKPLNHIWNQAVESCSTDFVCLLNNDVRIPPNFISSSLHVLDRESSVGFVNHVTNNLLYSQWSKELNYIVMDSPYRQGWDPVFRKSLYNQIPESLEFFYGDDYIYSKLYSSGYKGAYILNSPIIHFERSTTEEKGGSRDCSKDGENFKKMDLEYKDLSFNFNLCRWKPEFFNITKKDVDPILSILVCSLIERNNEFLSKLLDQIRSQIKDKPVELLSLIDNAKRPVGTKRNDLLKLAKGKYISFIDDDDRIGDSYIEDILKEIYEWSPDVVVFDAEITFNGVNPKLVRYGREYDYCEKSDAYYRHPNHLMVHRKENITEFFKDVKTGEDDEWASRMLPRIVTQSRIDKVLYYYDYSTITKKYFD